jgi:hypothetical protein
MAEKGEKAKKEDNVRAPPEMTVQDYISVSKTVTEILYCC